MKKSPQTRAYQSRPTSIHARTDNSADIAIIGAGIAGIAVAYYLCVENKKSSVLLIDHRSPMSYTSAQSGDNYRNWWPHPTMTAFANDSIDLMERLARDTDNVFNMTDRGYLLATRRAEVNDVVANLDTGTDVDVLSGCALVQEKFPAFNEDIRNVIHVKRGGDISGQQLGAYMLERVRDAGGKRIQQEVTGIEKNGAFVLTLKGDNGATTIRADAVVNAAGPFAGRVAAMLGIELPIKNIFQQKIAFDDRLAAVPRDMPFSIDLDDRRLGWTEEERTLLESDPDLAWLAGTLPGGTHCRPEGGQRGTWVKLGWAYNEKVSEPQQDLANEPHKDPQFPEIVIRGAAALLPSLRQYIEAPPTRFTHYGGYYSMTEENWPLIGPMGGEGAYVAGALSGFGSMAACAAGRLCATWICGGKLPDYAAHLSLARHEDAALMNDLISATMKGLL